MAVNHRDLKPSNLIWVGDLLKIADLGTANLGTIKKEVPNI